MTVMNARTRKIATLEAFQVLMKKHGATIGEPHDVPAGDEKKELGVWCSSAKGGCGSAGCRCSPGLWISASLGNKVVTAHWGYTAELKPGALEKQGDLTDDDIIVTPYAGARGEEVEWDEKEIDQWRRAMKELGL